VNRPTLIFIIAMMLIAGTAHAQVKYVAVVETETDAQSGAAAKINKAEVRQITAALRREAVNNLPRGKYNIMTSETVQAQGTAKLEECADENCVITLGSKIGADYIVRGIISKIGANLTVTVEMYETNDGTLVASSDLASAGDAAGLLEKAGAACARMYNKFLNDFGTVQKMPTTYTVTVNVNPNEGGYVSRSPNKEIYNAGEVLTLTATSYDGYTFTGWAGASNSKNATLKAPVDRDLTLTANFYRQNVPTSTYQSPVPEPKQPVTYTTPVASGARVFIATLPPKAEVYIGERYVGISNGGELQVPVGTHQVRFVKNGVEQMETMTFISGKNPTRFVNLKQ